MSEPASWTRGHAHPSHPPLPPPPPRYNALLGEVSASLAALARALRGQDAMGGELEAVAHALALNRVPPCWARAAYPSRRPLGAWLRDLARRVAFVEEWLTEGEPCAFWLPGLVHPQGLLTALVQNAARCRGAPVDTLTLAHRVAAPEEARALLASRRSARGAGGGGAVATAEGSDDADGAFVWGLHLEGARWDEAAGALAEAAPGQTLCPLPPVLLLPVAQELAPGAGRSGGGASSSDGGSSSSGGGGGGGSGVVYECPLYLTRARADFVAHLALPLPAGAAAEAFVLQGAAAVCASDDD
jgi:hypothetical protein